MQITRRMLKDAIYNILEKEECETEQRMIYLCTDILYEIITNHDEALKSLIKKINLECSKDEKLTIID